MKINIRRIMQLLAEQGLTKSELSSKSGVSRQQISVILGRGTCTPITAGKLAVGLGVPVVEIMEGVQ